MAAMLTYRTPASFAEKFARHASHAPCSEEYEAEAGLWSSGARMRLATAGASSAAGGGVDTTGGIALPAPPRKPHAGEASSASAVPAHTAASGDGARVGLPFWSVESYLHHQGSKFPSRFDPACYVALTYTLDTHDVGRGRGGVEAALGSLTVPVLVIGVDSDALYPLELQRNMAMATPGGSLAVLSSPHGHDGFLIEIDRLNTVVSAWMCDIVPSSVSSAAHL